jgi:hypothetical protein
MIKEWATDTAKEEKLTYAEGFRVISLISDEDWAKQNNQDKPGTG